MTALKINADKPRIFLSHIHEAQPLALGIKKGLEDAFADRVEAFVSSDPISNPGGDEWLVKIRDELTTDRVCMLIGATCI